MKNFSSLFCIGSYICLLLTRTSLAFLSCTTTNDPSFPTVSTMMSSTYRNNNMAALEGQPNNQGDKSLLRIERRTVYSFGKSRGCLFSQTVDNDEESDSLSLEAFQKARDSFASKQEEEEFDGYKFRDVILKKWGRCYDVDFNPVLSLGFRKMYLNVMPYQLGKRPFRHKTELDYLCHLQAVVEILEKYDQLEYVLQQISETEKRPRIGARGPIVCVSLRLDLTKDELTKILGF